MDIEQEASQMGWVPQEKFRGDPEKWVDAQTFVDRGKNVLPILRHNNERLMAEIEARKAAETALKTEVSSLKETVENLTTFQAEEVKRQVDRQVADIRKQLREAREAGDVDLEMELEDKLDDARSRQKEVAKAKPQEEKPKPQETQTLDPELVAWQRDNPWFEKDAKKTALALGIAQELREKGVTVTGRQFYDMVGEEVEKFFSGPGTSKVEGSSSGRGSSTPGGKSYSDLPAEARAVCDAQAKKFVGKPGFKDEAAWRAHYAKVYFGGQE